jgi:general secretion pathway protein I
MPAGRADRQGGFTLLEILVALSVLAIALVVVMQVFSANLRNLSASERYVHAMTRAESIMREIVESEPFKEAVLSGTTDDGFRYSTTVIPVLEDRLQPLTSDLLHIVLTVVWSDGRRERTVTLETYKMVERTL